MTPKQGITHATILDNKEFVPFIDDIPVSSTFRPKLQRDCWKFISTAKTLLARAYWELVDFRGCVLIIYAPAGRDHHTIHVCFLMLTQSTMQFPMAHITWRRCRTSTKSWDPSSLLLGVLSFS